MNTKIDFSTELLYRRWLLDHFTQAEVSEREAGQAAEQQQNGEFWTTSFSHKAEKKVDMTLINLPNDYVMLRIPAESCEMLKLINSDVQPQTIIRGEIERRYHKVSPADFAVVSVYDENDSKAIVEAKPKSYLLMVDKDLYAAMTMDAIKSILDNRYGHLVTKFDDHKKLIEELAKPASQVVTKITGLMEKAKLDMAGVMALSDFAASPESECYEVATVLRRYAREHIGHTAALEVSHAGAPQSTQYRPSHGGRSGG